MADLTYASASLTGADPSFVAADAGGDVVPTHPRGFLHVRNDDASPTTVTVVTPGKSRHGVMDEPDIDITVPAGEERLIGPMSRDLVSDDLGGVSVTYSSVTSLTVAAVRG